MRASVITSSTTATNTSGCWPTIPQHTCHAKASPPHATISAAAGFATKTPSRGGIRWKSCIRGRGLRPTTISRPPAPVLRSASTGKIATRSTITPGEYQVRAEGDRLARIRLQEETAQCTIGSLRKNRSLASINGILRAAASFPQPSARSLCVGIEEDANPAGGFLCLPVCSGSPARFLLSYEDLIARHPNTATPIRCKRCSAGRPMIRLRAIWGIRSSLRRAAHCASNRGIACHQCDCRMAY